jgi:protein CpxP
MRHRAFAMLMLVAGVAEAQVTPPRGGGAAARLGQPPAGANAPANRQELERRVRQALARVTRRQLALTDAQMTQLGQVDAKYERQRRQLIQQQRQNRLALRAAMLDTAGANQTQVAQHMDRLIQLERQRVDLLEAEQKDLAAFLTPLQRAKYQALQEQVRRRVEQAMRPAADDSLTPPAAGLRGQRRRPLVRPPE